MHAVTDFEKDKDAKYYFYQNYFPMRQSLYLSLFLFILSSACKEAPKQISTDDIKNIDTLIDGWHKAAANANFHDYFNRMSADAIFIGTDPTENWQLDAFKSFCKPYFEKGKAWSFTSLDRHLYFNQDHSIAWFDELLNTQMKICRGSGVLKKENGQWKIAHYVLSMTIPNTLSNEVTALKSIPEDHIIDSLTKNKL